MVSIYFIDAEATATYVSRDSVIPQHHRVGSPFDTRLVVTTLVNVVVQEPEDVFCGQML